MTIKFSARVKARAKHTNASLLRFTAFKRKNENGTYFKHQLVKNCK